MSKYDLTDEQKLFDLHRSCSEALDATSSALHGMLTTEDDIRDCHEARKVLIRAREAMRELLEHLDSCYELNNPGGGPVGFASPKENKCLD